MLSIVISAFFMLAFIGSLTVISMMFYQYRGRIESVIQCELQTGSSGSACQPRKYRHRTVKAQQLMNRPRSPQGVPLRAAA